MAFTPQHEQELAELIFALRDQALEPVGHARLEQLVLEHPEAREQFVTAMDLQAALHWRYAGDASAEAPSPAGHLMEPGSLEPYSPASLSPSPAAPISAAPSLPPAMRQPARHLTWWLVAASLLSAVGGWSVWNSLQPAGAEPHVAARVTRLTGVVWSGAAVEVGATLAEGRRLEPTAGIVELTFASGARVTLSGPARFDVLSAMRGRLETGAAAVKAPPELKGFVVETPSLTVTDLGTEFGVRAQPAGTSEVHVFDGSVEAAAVGQASNPVLLGERQAIQCDVRTGTLDDVVYDEEHFVRDAASRPVPPQPAAGFAESFDEPGVLEPQRGYRVETMEASRAAEHRQGTGAVEIAWKSKPRGYAVMYLAKKVPTTDVTGLRFEVWVKPLTGNSGYWGIELFDDQGQMVEQHRVFELRTNQWNRIVFRQGERTPGGHLAVGPGDRKRVAKVVFRAQTHGGGQSARDLWDDFQLVPPN